MATKSDRNVNYLDGLLPINLHDPLIAWSCKITWQTKITIVPMDTTLGTMETYLDGLLSINLHEPLITWH